jgi:hypothetical protein
LRIAVRAEDRPLLAAASWAGVDPVPCPEGRTLSESCDVRLIAKGN